MGALASNDELLNAIEKRRPCAPGGVYQNAKEGIFTVHLAIDASGPFEAAEAVWTTIGEAWAEVFPAHVGSLVFCSVMVEEAPEREEAATLA